MNKIILAILFSAILLTTVVLSGCTDLTGQTGGILCKRVIKNFKGCDKATGCYKCLHYSWGGLGSCDSCECEECLIGG